MSKGAVSERMFNASILFFVSAVCFGAAFIATSMSSRAFSWSIDTCAVNGAVQSDGDSETGLIVEYNLDMEADIGWSEFTVTYIDPGAGQNSCFATIEQGGVYPLGDFQNNNASAAGLGMVASWVVAIVVAIWAAVTMCRWAGGSRKGAFLLGTILKVAAFLCLGIIVSTTVFWWLVEGKFGNRRQALAPRLFELVTVAAEKCNEGTDSENPCNDADWDFESPGWALALGITALFLYSAAVVLLWLQADRADALSAGTDDVDTEPVKPVTGDFVVEKQVVQSDDKVRAKDRRSAKTGVRSGGRAPSATVQGGAAADMGADPMTYALEQGGDEDIGSQDDDDDEVVYQNHQVHHNVINHSTPNRTQPVDDHMARNSEAVSRASPGMIASARRQQQYSRGYSRGTSGGSYGGRSFEERSEADFSESASSAQYYGQNQGRSFMSASSQGGSFDEYH